MGLSEVVGVGLVTDEDGDILRWMMSWFQEQNPVWPKTRVFMTDKDLTERHVISEAFPEARLPICLFHTLRTFKREVTTAKMGITQPMVETLLEDFQSTNL